MLVALFQDGAAAVDAYLLIYLLFCSPHGCCLCVCIDDRNRVYEWKYSIRSKKRRNKKRVLIFKTAPKITKWWHHTNCWRKTYTSYYRESNLAKLPSKQYYILLPSGSTIVIGDFPSNFRVLAGNSSILPPKTAFS